MICEKHPHTLGDLEDNLADWDDSKVPHAQVCDLAICSSTKNQCVLQGCFSVAVDRSASCHYSGLTVSVYGAGPFNDIVVLRLLHLERELPSIHVEKGPAFALACLKSILLVRIVALQATHMLQLSVGAAVREREDGPHLELV